MDKEALDSVLEGKVPAEWRRSDTRQSTAHVIVLDMQWFDLRDGPHEDEDLGAEVGWTKVLALKVYPSGIRFFRVDCGRKLFIVSLPRFLVCPKFATFSSCIGHSHITSINFNVSYLQKRPRCPWACTLDCS